jgi:DNA polymerase III epsilon subunit-like protein
MSKYIAIDCETGGIDPSTSSLLVLYCAILDEDFQMIDEREYLIRPDGATSYWVTPGALKVNGIDIVEHDKKARKASDVSSELYSWLELHSGGGKDKLVPIGHNVQFDLDFIHSHLLAKGTWERFVSYRKLCTAAILQFLKFAGKIPSTVSGSLTSIAEYIGAANFKTYAHNARADTLMTVKVLKKMKDLINKHEK